MLTNYRLLGTLAYRLASSKLLGNYVVPITDTDSHIEKLFKACSDVDKSIKKQNVERYVAKMLPLGNPLTVVRGKTATVAYIDLFLRATPTAGKDLHDAIPLVMVSVSVERKTLEFLIQELNEPVKPLKVTSQV